MAEQANPIGFAELLCTSNFSFLRSASHPEDMVAQAAQLGYTALAITDECSLAGIVRAHVAAKEHKIHLLVGAQFVFSASSPFAGLRVALIVKNETGYKHLCRLITQARMRAQKGSYLFTRDDLADIPPGLIVLICPSADDSPTDSEALIRWASQRFHGRLAIAVSYQLNGYDASWIAHWHGVATLHGAKLLATNDAVMHCPTMKPLHDVLTAIDHNQPLKEITGQLQTNAQRHLKPISLLAQQFAPAMLEHTLNIAKQCTFSLDSLRYQYPKEISPDGQSPSAYLKQVTYQGLEKRFPLGASGGIHQQIERELSLITELGYEPYFLTVYDIVRFARSRGILCQGRGSAANSAVCYCLGITEVDPERTSLLFERFISKERNEPPDIDVDFEHHRREEVIQYLYQKYGRHRAALAASVVVYRPRSAIRDAGKALGLPNDLVDTLAKTQDGMYARVIEPTYIEQAGLDIQDPRIQQCLHMAEQLLGFPRHLSQHTGGFVIARDTLSELVPIENASMPDRSVIQWDKDDLDAMGLLKVDVLALGMLSAIRLTLDALTAKPMAPRKMQDIPAEDKATYEMISRADTMGVFQVESRAQMSMLPKLRPQRFYDLVIQVAIVRPGPIQGGMVHPFLQRRQGHEAVSFPSAALREALERTEGVPIFQEQVMQIAILAAGFTPGQADALRRGMAAWKRKGGLHHFYDKVVGGMVARGYTREFAENIFKQIEGFGEYGFPESHAASFALLVYVSSWLKCHHPDAFLCGLLNAQPMGFYKPSQLIRNAQQAGVNVLPIDVMHSNAMTTLIANPPNGYAVRVGLHMVKGLSKTGLTRIIQAREQRAFDSLEDLAKRAVLDKKDLLALSDSNALKTLCGNRHQAAWHTSGIDRSTDLLANSRTTEPPVTLKTPNDLEELLADYRATHFSLDKHPVGFLRPVLEAKRITPAKQLLQYPNRRLARACGLVTHRQKPATAKGVVFLTLEDESGQINVTVWPELAQEQRHILRHAQILTVYGVWQRDGEVSSLLAKRLEDATELLSGLVAVSRDFH